MKYILFFYIQYTRLVNSKVKKRIQLTRYSTNFGVHTIVQLLNWRKCVEFWGQFGDIDFR